MTIFDQFCDRAADALQVAGKKAEEAYGVTKLKVKIADKQSQIRNLYRELGELVYENSKKDEADLEAVEDKVAEIDLAYDAINEMKELEKTMKKLVVCPNCGEQVPEESLFCMKCGSEL